MVEGTWYCPSMPNGLINATADLIAPKDSPDKIERETWTKRIAAREHYRLLAKGKPDDEGKLRPGRVQPDGVHHLRRGPPPVRCGAGPVERPGHQRTQPRLTRMVGAVHGSPTGTTVT
ncbi:hypothetical protein [Actinomadura sp. NBRC 104412]|uniref:hypothetical protein n=1 Tax=Actinomadura sp. NBRC 104412 TaxID=3032203 RepID=UPI002553A90B|nr:hypothetical protein [Actinomadura sp. NBRC 104412]